MTRLKRYLKYRKRYDGEKCWFITTPQHLYYNIMLLGKGDHASVMFDYQDIYEIADTIPEWLTGFYHLHPPSFRAFLSQTDIDTMRAWVTCLGWPLRCFVDCGGDIKGWYFWYNGSIHEVKDGHETYQLIVPKIEKRLGL